MLGFLSKIALTGANQLSHLSSVINTAHSSLLRCVTGTINGSTTTSCISNAIQKRSKCFDHHFLNRWMARDYKRRKQFEKHFPLRQRYIAIKKCSILPKELQEVAGQELHELPRDSCFSHLNPRCILTSRPRWVIRKYRLSRIQWRLLADYNKLSGVLRATW